MCRGDRRLQCLYSHGAHADRRHKRPDLAPLIEARPQTSAKVLKKRRHRRLRVHGVSRVHRGDCVPILEKVSGLKFNNDFFAGYSPERINPGDKQHRLTNIKKVTSGSTPEAADFVDACIARSSPPARTRHQHQGGRGRQGHREHAARPQHRADQRAGDAVQPAGHRHRRSAAGGRHQVEFPAVPSGPGGRPLHRRRSLLPDPQGAGSRLSPGNDPGRPPHQRQHGLATSPARSSS